MRDAARIVFGTAALGLRYGLPRSTGGAGGVEDEQQATRLVERALEVGIDTYDTAPAYGLAEERLGRALKGRGCVWTKVSHGDVVASVECSLRVLRRDVLDVVQWHNWSPAVGATVEFSRAWEALARSPNVKALGASTYGAEDAVAAVTSGRFSVVQIEWNILNRGVLDAVATEASKRGVTLALRTVLLQGALTDEGRKLPERPVLVERVRRARLAAEAFGLPLEQVALRAALDQGCRVLVGFDREAQLEQAICAAALAPLDSEALRALDAFPDSALDPRGWNVT